MSLKRLPADKPPMQPWSVGIHLVDGFTSDVFLPFAAGSGWKPMYSDDPGFQIIKPAEPAFFLADFQTKNSLVRNA